MQLVKPGAPEHAGGGRLPTEPEWRGEGLGRVLGDTLWALGHQTQRQVLASRAGGGKSRVSGTKVTSSGWNMLIFVVPQGWLQDPPERST